MAAIKPDINRMLMATGKKVRLLKMGPTNEKMTATTTDKKPKIAVALPK